jgi:putative endonuclease
MYFVYAVYNKKHGKFYIGQTKDLSERIKLHNDLVFKNSYTNRFDGRWELIYNELAKDRKQALKREKQLKSYRGREFIKAYIRA